MNTDALIRYMFNLDNTVDLDKPVANLEFRSYREAYDWIELCRQEFCRRYQEGQS